MNTRTVLLLIAVLVLGGSWANKPLAQAEPRRNAPQQAFTSGAMRSEKILREIAVVLRSIDARLARVETTVEKMRIDAARNANFGGGRRVQ